MAEYIEREVALQKVKKLQETDPATIGKKQFADGYFAGLDELEIILRGVPTAEAAIVVHGHWVKYNFLGHDQFACSECQTLGSPQWKRCPVCEAKMDGERKSDG